MNGSYSAIIQGSEVATNEPTLGAPPPPANDIHLPTAAAALPDAIYNAHIDPIDHLSNSSFGIASSSYNSALSPLTDLRGLDNSIESYPLSHFYDGPYTPSELGENFAEFSRTVSYESHINNHDTEHECANPMRDPRVHKRRWEAPNGCMEVQHSRARTEIPSRNTLRTRRDLERSRNDRTCPINAYMPSLGTTLSGRWRVPIPVLGVPEIIRDSTETSHTSIMKDAKSQHVRYVQEARRFMLGPMPVQDFIHEFLPRDTDMTKMPPSVDAFKKIPAKPERKTDIYGHLIRAINGAADDNNDHKYNGRSAKRKTAKLPKKKQGEELMALSRCPGFVFRNTSNCAENTDLESPTPDICCYNKGAANLAIASSNHLGYAELFIEVKETVAHDFFKDPPDDADRSRYQFMLDITNEEAYERAEESLGHHVAYATEACARQHRTFYLSMSLAGTFLRFIRWDRAGAIVSESFDIRAQPEFLCDFLWRFAHASLTQRGHDPTLEFAAPGDEDRFREIISARVKIETGLTGEALDDAIEEHYKPGLVIIINVEDDLGAHRERLLVSRPVAYPLSVAGRATRGYWAVTASDDVVFLKDSWRYLAMEKEGVTIEEMEKAGVVNIPRSHPRDVPMELRDEVPENAPMLALTSAYVETHRLHRNVGIGNIIIVRECAGVDRRGILIDWELSSIADDNGKARDYQRTGIWNFMSGRLLKETGLGHIIQDDMDSMLWVVLYCGYLWLRVKTLTDNKLDDIVYELFEYSRYNVEKNTAMGGNAKRHNALSREYTNYFEFECVPFQKFCETMMDYHHPLDHTKVELAGKWEHPRHFEEVWDTFLRTNEDNFVGISAKKHDNK
ncbi:hypothetical protein B0H21DRAFT_887034, partial [Amylocystis lapponica]